MMGFLNNKNLRQKRYDKPSQQGLQRLQVTGSIVSTAANHPSADADARLCRWLLRSIDSVDRLFPNLIEINFDMVVS